MKLTRRDALRLLAATGASAAAAGCAPGDGAGQAAGSGSPGPAPADDPILGVTALGAPPWPTLDPFLFCVHHDDRYPSGNERMGPAASLAGRSLGMDFEGKDGWRMYHGAAVPGFPQHPHRGFETVTVVRRGLLDHADSLGAAARYGEGDVQWLTAGQGILHSEMFPLLRREGPNPVELFQIWLNLPAARKMVEPHFSMLWRDDIPRRTVRDSQGRQTEVTVVAGRYGEVAPPSPPPSSWASEAAADVAIWTIRMEPGARFTLPVAPAGVHRALYFFAGSALKVGDRDVPPSRRVDLRAEAAVALEAGPLATEILLLQGRPIGEPVVQHGPFVMTSRDEIGQAFADYRRTQFGGWPWPTDEPVHGRAEGRFARHADGRMERPA